MSRVCQGRRSMSTLVITFWCKTYILYFINKKWIHVDVMSMEYCPCWRYVKGDIVHVEVMSMLTLCPGRRFFIVTNIIIYTIIYMYVFMDPCLGYVNAYIWTPNCRVMPYIYVYLLLILLYRFLICLSNTFPVQNII